jgi:hypothetical protein
MLTLRRQSVFYDVTSKGEGLPKPLPLVFETVENLYAVSLSGRVSKLDFDNVQLTTDD